MQQRAIVPPPPEELRDYSLGKCQRQRALEIEAFLAGGAACASILSAAPDDAVVRHLRGAGALPGATESEAATLPRYEAEAGAGFNPPGYEVLEELGRGGMGVVYRARQVALNRVVALKMILAGGHAGAAASVRFRTEAEAVARLQHPNIVQVHEVGEHSGLPFMALEFCPGGSLERRLGGTPLPAPEATALVETLARAVQAAHARQIVHRDLTPANVLLAEDGVPKIADFGLARLLDEAGQTASGDVMGTPSYMAPEQAAGKGKEVGPACDVYALGAILYECLTGRPPFKAATVLDTVRQVVDDEPVLVRQLQPRTPRDLETICLKCLQKDPHKRYASAEELADDLGRFRRGEPITARPVGRCERAGRWCRRNPVVAALLGAVVAVLLMGTTVSLHFAIQATHRAVEAENAQLQSLLAEARARRFSGQTGQRFESLRALTQAAELARRLNKDAGDIDKMRNLAIAALALPDVRLEKDWEGWPEGICRLNIDDRLEHYARSDVQGNVTVLRLADDAEVVRLPGNGDIVSCGFDAAGSSSLTLFDYSDRSLKRWDFRDGTLTRLAQAPGEDRVEMGQTTADGQRLVWLHADGALNVCDWPSGRRLHSQPIRFGKWLRPGAATVGLFHYAFHPSRHLLAITLGLDQDPERQVVRIVDLDRGEVVANLRRQTGDTANKLAWHPDGKTLAVGYDQAIVLWDVPTRREVRVIGEHKGGGLWACFDRTGEVLLSWSTWAGGMQLRHTQTGQRLLTAPDLRPNSCGPLSDGRLSGLRIDGTRLQLWVIDPARECRTLVRDPARGDVGEYWRHAIHPAGRLAAVGTSTGVTLLDLVAGLDVGHLDLGHNFNVAFDPATGDLLTYGERGLFRWPVQTAADAPGRLRVGLPQDLHVPGRKESAAIRLSDDGKTLALAQGDHALVLHQDRPEQPVILRPLEDVRSHVTITSDGRWVATGRNDGYGGDIRVWDAWDGKLLKEFGIPDGMCVRFSPDGRWLVGNDKSAYRFWHVGSWEEGPQAPVQTPLFVDWPPAFSPDGCLLALERGDGAVRLIEVASGRELAVLEDQQQGRSGAMTFSPDGTQLLLTNKDNQVLRLWDLRRLRAGLKAIDLDWAAPPYPAEDRAVPPPGSCRPLGIEVVGLGAAAAPE